MNRIFGKIKRETSKLVAVYKAVLGKRTILYKGNSTYFDDGMATRHHVGFQHDIAFTNAFSDAIAGIDNGIDFSKVAWRAHIVTWAANQAIALNGDFVECGVWYGVLSKTICNYVDFNNYAGKFYLIDSWGKMEGSHAADKYQANIYEKVKKRFAEFTNVELIRGLVPEALSKVDSKRIAYLSIDMNGYLAELAALEYFYPKMLTGGIIYFDDYGRNYPKLRETIDGFFADKPETLLHFPSGNSIVVKQ